MLYIIITGASRGFGRALAIDLASKCPQPVHFLLSSGPQSKNLLHNTLEEIINVRRGIPFDTKVDSVTADLSDLDSLSASTSILLKDFEGLSFADNVLYINNAGSLGTLAGVGTEPLANDVKPFSDAYNLNVTASSYITSEVLRRYKGKVCRLTLVNISSLAASQPINSWALYCSGKAAREMFYRCIALENEGMDDCVVRVLNYCPGTINMALLHDI